MLRAINDQGPLEPREIGEICCISSPSMAGVLSRMQDMGLIVRERMEKDQRRQLVSLTQQSKALIAKVTPLIEATYRELEELLGRDEIDALYRRIDRLLQTLAPQD